MSGSPRGVALPRILFVTGADAPEISSGGLQVRQTARQLRGRCEMRVLTTATDAALPRQSTVDDVPVWRIAVDPDSVSSKAVAAWRMTHALLHSARGRDV